MAMASWEQIKVEDMKPGDLVQHALMPWDPRRVESVEAGVDGLYVVTLAGGLHLKAHPDTGFLRKSK